MLNFFVAGRAVSTNQIYGHGRHGEVYLTRAARNWREQVYYGCLAAYGPARAPVYVYPRVSLHFQGIQGDADNYLKMVFDGLKMALGRDDKFFSIGSVTVQRGGEAGVHVTVEEGSTQESEAGNATSVAR